ncbi:MAG: MBL fold metallo-hydrolase, partial [Myxococcales bacterium]|nr:MBL fold metallo-hydrolase [Myxococcales bacterium]
MSHLTWKIGDVRITRFAERETLTRLTVLLPEATPESIEPHASWLSPHFLASDGKAILSIHALLIESQGQLILVDTCMGEKVV